MSEVMAAFELRTAEGRTVCERCEVADTPLRRMRGLLGRAALASGEGLLLRPAGSVHTAFMRFSIDVVFVADDGAVVRIARELAPWRTAAARGARAVLELPAGDAARRGLAVGDRLALPAAGAPTTPEGSPATSEESVRVAYTLETADFVPPS